MKYLITTVLILFLLSCNDSKTEMPGSGPHKIISVFRPAFGEASEITFIESDSLSHLSILIRKNVRLDETEDSFFYKVVVLDENQKQAIQNKVLMYFNLSFDGSIKVVVDGIGISYLHIFKDDTTYYSFQSPAEGTSGYKLATVTLDTYERIFRDTTISDYFNELRGYISGAEYVEPKTMIPLKQLREEKYAGLIKYSR